MANFEAYRWKFRQAKTLKLGGVHYHLNSKQLEVRNKLAN